MAGHLNWTLKQIFLAQGDLNRTLADWFERNERLRMTYGLVDRIYPDVKAFDNPEHKWQGIVARKLYAVYHLARGAAIRMHEAGIFDPFTTWRFLNCRPYGGNWISAYDVKKAAGKQCRNLLCPWCYLRRYDALKKLLKAPVTEQIRFPAGNVVSNPGVLADAQEGLSATVFDAYGDGQIVTTESDTAYSLNAAQRVALRRAFQDDVKRRCTLALKRRLEDCDGQNTTATSSAEFLAAVATMMPVIRTGDGKVGIRLTYLHNTPFPGGRTKFKLMGDHRAISGVIEMERVSGLSVEKALLLAQPHPWDLFDKTTDSQLEVLSSMYNRSMYTRLPRLRGHDSNQQ
jgi:hypothetical protein